MKARGRTLAEGRARPAAPGRTPRALTTLEDDEAQSRP